MTAAREPPFAVLLGLAWLLAVAQLLADGWAISAVTLPDADDAMRLVELRAWLGGHGWFDLHEARLAPPTGYDSHWSRLIDLGLAGLLLGFRWVADAALAERLTLVLWPMLWLLPAIGAAAAIAWRVGGREAALVALLMAAFSMPAFQQFRPGRIDHHNVHLTLSLAVVALACWADRWRHAGTAAGLLTGLALAIGFESLPFVMLAGASFAARTLIDPSSAPALRAYGLTTAASTVAAFFVSVAPGHWTTSVCDGIAINSGAAVVIGALGLAVATMFDRRLVGVAAAGVAAFAVFAAFEPRCLAGPYAMVDPAIGPAWLDHVAEVQPLSRMLRESLQTGLATLAFPAVAAIAALSLAWHRRDAGFLVAAAACLLAGAMTLVVVKAFSYAVWFGLPLVAGAAVDLLMRFKVHGLVPRFLAALVITPTAVTLGAMTIASATGSQPLQLNTSERQACVRKDNIAALAALPPGLIVTNELEWGPYLLAWTPHAVLAAPYHRLSQAIVAAHAALARPPDEAKAIVTDAHATYIVLCGSRGPLGLDDAAMAASLWGHLRAGDVPPWLVPLPPMEGSPFTVYRVGA